MVANSNLSDYINEIRHSCNVINMIFFMVICSKDFNYDLHKFNELNVKSEIWAYFVTMLIFSLLKKEDNKKHPIRKPIV